MKRILTAVLCTLLVFSLFSCAPSKKQLFKDEATEWFATFDDSQKHGKSETVFEYNDTGFIGYEYIKTGFDNADAVMKSTLEKYALAFNGTTKDDKLLMAYKVYMPSDSVMGAELCVKSVIGGTEETKTEFINFNKTAASGYEIPEMLKKMAVIEARDKNNALSKDCQLLYTDTGIMAFDGTNRVEIGYNYLRPYIPESIKQNVEPDESIRVIDVTKKMVAITYDDGPHGVYTKQLLDILEKNGAVATFFEVGQNLQIAPEQLIRADKMGCEIGSHTWSHANLETSSRDKITEQIEKADDEFESVLGFKPKTLRPPYGAVGDNLFDICDKGLIGWSVDTEDWRYRDAQKVIASVKNQKNLDGDVILMHSLYKSTVEASEYLIPWLIENDYQLVTVSELIKYRYEDTYEKGEFYAYNYYNNKPKGE